MNCSYFPIPPSLGSCAEVISDVNRMSTGWPHGWQWDVNRMSTDVSRIGALSLVVSAAMARSVTEPCQAGVNGPCQWVSTSHDLANIGLIWPILAKQPVNRCQQVSTAVLLQLLLKLPNTDRQLAQLSTCWWLLTLFMHVTDRLYMHLSIRL